MLQSKSTSGSVISNGNSNSNNNNNGNNYDIQATMGNSVRGMVDQMSSSSSSYSFGKSSGSSVMEESGERIPLSGTSSPAGPPMILFHYPKSADIANTDSAVKSPLPFNPASAPSSSLPSMPYLRRYSSLISGVNGVSKSVQQLPQLSQQQQQVQAQVQQQQQQEQLQRQQLDSKFYPAFFPPSTIGQLANGMDFARSSDITRVTNVAGTNYSPLGGNAYITADSDYPSSSAMQSGQFYWPIVGPGSSSSGTSSMSDGNSPVAGIPLAKYSRVNGNNNPLQSPMDSPHAALAASSMSLDGSDVWNKESIVDPVIHRDMSDHTFNSLTSKASIYNGNNNNNNNKMQHNSVKSHHEPSHLEPHTSSTSSVAKIRSPSFLQGVMLPPRISAVTHLRDSNSSGRDTNSAVIALSLGLLITVMLIAIVVLRMRTIKRRISRRGGRSSLTHDADYLINGMYL